MIARHDPGRVTVYADGSVASGEDRASVAWIIKREDNTEIARHAQPVAARMIRRLNGKEHLKPGSSKRHGVLVLMAEYGAVIAGIAAARKFGYWKIRVCTDSLPLVADMAGERITLPPEVHGLRQGLRAHCQNAEITFELFKLGQVHDLANGLITRPREIPPEPFLMQHAHFNDVAETLDAIQKDVKSTKGLTLTRLRLDRDPKTFREMDEELAQFKERLVARIDFMRQLLQDYSRLREVS